MVSCKLINVKHTARNIAKVMKLVFKEYEITPKVFRVISDNASSMIKAVRDLKSLRPREEEAFDEDDLINDSDEEGEGSSLPGLTDSENESEDEEPDELSEEDTEVQEVNQYVDELESDDRDHKEVFKEMKVERNRCVLHKLQLPIQKI